MMKKRFCILFLAIIVIFSISHTALADYIHEYFRYTVEDESVTITGYYGEESSVTVPAFIGGNPVNVIASGAFANNTAVLVVYLPDTIMSVEAGAFGPGQSAVYTSGTTESGSSDSSITDPPVQPQALGIYDDYGNLITTDDEGNLILVDKEGNERVLDDTQTYYRDADDSGNLIIVSEFGEIIEITNGDTISFEDAGNNQITVHTDSGSIQVVDKETGTGMETVEVDLTEESSVDNNANDAADSRESDTAEAESRSAEMNEENDRNSEEEKQENDTSYVQKPSGFKTIIIVIVVIAAIVIILAGISWRKRRTK